MIRKQVVLCFLGMLFTLSAFAQSDPYTGSWKIASSPKKSPVTVELHIGNPAHNLLYPATLSITRGDFTGHYDLLLVKKNSRQLAIGRHKIPVSETPFSLKNLLLALNGTFDLTKDKNGQSILTVSRLFASGQDKLLPEFKDLQPQQKGLADTISYVIRGEEIRLIKTDTTAWNDTRASAIVQPEASENYFGIMDTLSVKKNEVATAFPGSRKNNNGIVSFMRNGKYVFEYAYLSESRPREEIRLDTGLNYLVLFAEEFGKKPDATGSLEISFDKRKVALDFGAEENAGATFIVAPFYYEPPVTDNDSLQQTIIADITALAANNNQKIWYYPANAGTGKADSVSKEVGEQYLKREAKVVGNVRAISQKVMLALWDDAVEDGDSISLNINGTWVARGLPVKKQPQFISVMLNPGTNKIIFIADNQGTIIPNTSILEIIDGRQRKSFKIDTDFSQNNQIDISYEFIAKDQP